MISIAIQQFFARWQRSLAVFVAVMLGVAFLTVSLLAGGPLNHNLQSGVGQQVQGADLVITTQDQSLYSDALGKLKTVDGVAEADVASFASTEMTTRGTTSYLLVSDAPQVDSVRSNIDLKQGRWPESSGEIVLAQQLKVESSLNVGDTVSLFDWSTEKNNDFTVVGFFESPTGLAFGRSSAFLTSDDYQRVFPDMVLWAIRVAVEPGSDISTMQEVIQRDLGDGYTVQTFSSFVDAEVEEFAGNTIALQAMLGAFAVVALVASGIVIANSFEISIAQRVREIGLLRSVGVSNRQIRNMVITESLVVGAIASTLGVVLGVLLLSFAGRLLWARDGGPTGVEVSPLAIAAPIMFGLVITLIAAFGPARRAMRVHPVQALRQADAPIESPQVSRLRLIAAGLLLIVGVAVLAGAAVMALGGQSQTGLPALIGIVGGTLTFAAVLISAQVILPKFARIVGGLMSRFFGVTGELATGNLARNPARTASSAVALLMGVALMTMMVVGADSVKSTLVGEVSSREPIDLQIEVKFNEAEMADLSRQSERWADINGVEQVITTRAASLILDGVPDQLIVGVDPDQARSVMRSDGLIALDDTSIIVSAGFALDNGFEEGDVIAVSGSGGTVDLVVRIDRSGIYEPVVSLGVLEATGNASAVNGVWMRVDSNANVGDIMDQVLEGAPPAVELQVSGGAEQRNSTLEVLDLMLMVVIGLLAASVVIAIVGIGNTLTLSVIERTRENGMLRAIGLKRKQVRVMLALEGVAISLIGALVGVMLGIAYGLVGTLTILGDSLDLSYSVPWLQILMICAVAIASGLLASILPAQRALKVAPVEALSNLG